MQLSAAAEVSAVSQCSTGITQASRSWHLEAQLLAHIYFVTDLSLVFTWTLYHRKQKFMHYNSEAFFTSSPNRKIIQLIHYIVML